MSKDNKTVQEVIVVVDPPTAQSETFFKSYSLGKRSHVLLESS